MPDSERKEPLLQPTRTASYFRIWWCRAIRDTEQGVWADIRLDSVIAVTAVLAPAVVKYSTGESVEMDTLFSSLLDGLFLLGLVVLAYFLYNFLAAPSRIYWDKQNEITEIQKKIAELEKVQEQRIEGLRADFAQSFHGCADTRAKLWSILDIASARQREGEIDSGSVRESMREVEFPENILKIRQNDSLYEYATEVRGWWGGKKKEFFEFCLTLYQQEDEWQGLDNYRRDLAKFWDDWERKCKSQGMSVGDIVGPDLMQSQAPDVVMLTYLEIARGLHEKENSRGKQGLFKVAQEFREFSNL